ncbi:uncharacterized protein METZ01_LOCUS422794, partial [marine metagenome]
MATASGYRRALVELRLIPPARCHYVLNHADSVP